MIKFDEQKQLDSTAGALTIRKEIERIAEDVAGRGYSNLCYLGIGGTYASALQTQSHVQENSGMEIIAQNAALYNTTGNRRIGKIHRKHGFGSGALIERQSSHRRDSGQKKNQPRQAALQQPSQFKRKIPERFHWRTSLEIK